MKTKHTPGPWTVEYDGDGCHVTFDDGPVVYDTTEESDESRADVAELKANGRLIAAAPEMYELLHAIWGRTDPADRTCRIIANLLDRVDNSSGGDE